jgi:murein lipoprotein
MPAPEVFNRFNKELEMRSAKIKRMAGIVTLAAVAGLAGCATTSDLDSLRGEIRQANETAANAAATADAARKEAAAASQTAAEAKAMSEATDAKIDRMFKKSMYK